MVLPFIYNLFKRHPGCMAMIQRTDEWDFYLGESGLQTPYKVIDHAIYLRPLRRDRSLAVDLQRDQLVMLGTGSDQITLPRTRVHTREDLHRGVHETRIQLRGFPRPRLWDGEAWHFTHPR